MVRQDVELGNISADAGSLRAKSGAVRGLLVLSDKPYPFLPKVPALNAVKRSMSKQGYALVETFANAVDATGRGLATTPGTPANRVQFLSAALEKARANPQLIAEAERHGYVPAYLTGKAELALFRRAVADAAMRSPIVKSFQSGK